MNTHCNNAAKMSWLCNIKNFTREINLKNCDIVLTLVILHVKLNIFQRTMKKLCEWVNSVL